ncbi:hypothetical protein HK099_007442 [Clydaea vesicula]|uniref:NIF3-like protein 1 n=1 Tax=Clydaea vesicula TaxID=447962 RepID=A0AAD5Y2R6_9FUNG|nr:hypothetical protein HK099_007442 [Clydaea vesicula]
MLANVTRTMEKIAPIQLAEAWDNVGLLIETAAVNKKSKSVFLTIDLTNKVLNECLQYPDVGLIISYHPPLFSSFKRLTMKDPKQAIAIRCISQGISVYSPHTALDSCKSGINDWLGKKLGSGTLKFITPVKENVLKNLTELNYLRENEAELVGSGRILTLDNSVSLNELVAKVKEGLKLKHVRVAPKDSDLDLIKTVAICAGSGASVLLPVKADLYLTGEMSHHEVLAANANGTSVVLCEHSNTERGYLTEVLKPKLLELFKNDKLDYNVIVSEVDNDPLSIY